MSKKCVFFDRDGIVNRSPGPGYVERLEDFHILPEFIEAMRTVQAHGYEAAIITNQRGVATGRIDPDILETLHETVHSALDREGLALLDIYVCPHDNDTCECRKPQPGMLLRAAREHELDLAKSWMIGDQEKDITAGRTAGCRTILVSPSEAPSEADYRLPSMGDLAAFLDQRLDPAPEGE